MLRWSRACRSHAAAPDAFCSVASDRLFATAHRAFSLSASGGVSRVAATCGLAALPTGSEAALAEARAAGGNRAVVDRG